MGVGSGRSVGYTLWVGVGEGCGQTTVWVKLGLEVGGVKAADCKLDWVGVESGRTVGNPLWVNWEGLEVGGPYG